MNRKILLLNLLLLGAIGALGWTLRKQWREGDAQTRAIMSRRVPPPSVIPPPAPAPVPAVAPAEYIEVAQKTLYSSDRNPNVVVVAPPPPPPPPPMPALPIYYGQMHFGGDPVVVLAMGTSPEQKSYSVGQKVGEFKLVAFNRDTITFDWNGKEVERKLDDLAPKQAQQPQPGGVASTQSPAPPPPPAAPARGGSVTPIGAPGGSSTTDTKDPLSGTDMGGVKACVMGDTTPAGTVKDGWKKVVGGGLLGMGQSCHWEQTK